MALDKAGVKVKMNHYYNALRSAQNAIDGAARQLNTARQSIEDEWKGEAGSEMATQLENLRAEIQKLSSRIDGIQQTINTRRNRICDNWTDES